MRPWPSREDQLRRLLPRLRGRGPVLDLGCGTGILLDLLAEARIPSEGVEQVPALVAAVRRRGHAVQRAEVLAFVRRSRPNRYGALVASHIVEHVPQAKLPALLAGMTRVLKPGGLAIILTPNPRNIGVITQTFWGDLEHTRPYALHLLTRLVEEAGLRIVEAGDDPYTRQPGILHRPLNLLRRLLIGNYWAGADLLVIAEKPRR